nr:hypothetical protein CTI12_AA053730 [Tanacetum cinerariifolium]
MGARSFASILNGKIGSQKEVLAGTITKSITLENSDLLELSDISNVVLAKASDNDQTLHSANELEDEEGEVNAYWAPNIESKEDKSTTNSLERKDDEGPSLDGGSEHEEPLDVDNCDSDAS